MLKEDYRKHYKEAELGNPREYLFRVIREGGEHDESFPYRSIIELEASQDFLYFSIHYIVDKYEFLHLKIKQGDLSLKFIDFYNDFLKRKMDLVKEVSSGIKKERL